MDIAEAAKKAQEIIDKEEAGDPKLKKALKVVREFIQTHPVQLSIVFFRIKINFTTKKKIFPITISLAKHPKFILQRLRID